MSKLAIIGGSGFTDWAELTVQHRMIVRTPYGEASGPLTFGTVAGVEVVFLARHGYGHTLAPHEVNYRANLWALQSKDVTDIIAVNAVGGIARDLPPGTLALPDQIIDYTWGRKSTFFEGAEQPVVHTDFTHPYSESLRTLLLEAARAVKQPVMERGVYACTQGPRLETAAEIVRLERDGATLVGMTGMPEAALARELKQNYASLAVVANWAAGRGSSAEEVSIEDIIATLKQGTLKARHVLAKAISLWSASNGRA